jgi:hypothetical protein
MICRVLIKFNQNSSKNQASKEHKLLTFRLLIIIKDQLNETPRGKQRGIKIPTAQDKSRSKLRGTYPERD